MLDAVAEVEEAAGNEPVLVAFVAPDRSKAGSDATVALLRAACAAELPAHMVPNRVVFVPEIPLRPSGKLDRARLRDVA